MRRRLHPKTSNVSSRLDTTTSKVRFIKVEEPVRLVTLENPGEGTQEARGAFARIKPPEGTPVAETDAWRLLVARHAIAVKVLPTPKSADVPNDSQRVKEDEHIGTIREEALILANETENEEVIDLTTAILDQIGCR